MNNRYLVPALLCLFTAFSLPKLAAQNTTNIVSISGPAVVCQGGCITLIPVFVQGVILPPTVIFQWEWVGPNGINGTKNSKSLDDCPPTVGQYVYYLRIFTPDGAIIAETKTVVTVLPFQPLRIISSNTAPCNADSSIVGSACEKVCPNTTVTYSVDLSAPSASKIQWQVNSAQKIVYNPPFGASVTVTWGGPGTGSVSVFVKDSIADCSSEAALCVTVIAEPEAKFSTLPAASGGTIQVCKGQTVYFSNQSSGADYYEWSFSDDASTSPQNNPQHTYLTPGTYTVSLVARSACLCADTTKIQVQVLDAESPTLDCVGTICPGETVTYTAANGCAPFVWSVSPNGNVLDGGNANSDSIKIEWTTGPSGTITLGAQTCSGAACPLPANILVPIISDAAEIKGQERVCPGVEEQYSIDPFGGTNFKWKLSSGGTIASGQGTSSVVVKWADFPQPNAHLLSVEYESCYLGCKGSDTIAVRILSPVFISGPVEICEGASGGFNTRLVGTLQSISSNWTLTGPDGSTVWSGSGTTANPSFNAGAGFYRLIAKPADPNQTCSEQADWAINVAARPAKPTAILGEKNICPAGAYTYEVKGVSPQSNVSWTVQNGPGAPTTQPGNPINVTWGATGPRSLVARQISTDGLGCQSDTARLSVAAITAPLISGKPNVCENSTATYTLGPLQGVDIQWRIVPASAGAIADGQGKSTVEIYWSQPGGHSLEVDVCGQTGTFPITVLAPPDPMVQHPTGLCTGATGLVQTTGTFSQYTWKDANGTVLSTLAKPTLQPGSYAVQVTDANGCTGTESFTVEAFPGANVSLTTADPTGFCNNSQFVTLTALTNGNGDLTYQWFQNGNPLGGATGANYATNQYGNYTVIATNAQGCSAQAGPINLFNYCGGGVGGGVPGGGVACPPGAMNLLTDPNARCDSFQFHLQDNIGQYVAGSANWLFFISGGTTLGTSTLDDPNFVFPNAGKYIVAVQVTLSTGAVCLLIDSVRVEAKAQFKFTPDCPGQATEFEDISTFLPGSGVSGWQWDFGDPASGGNNTSALQNPQHTYSGTGTYPAMLTVTDKSGCTSEATQPVVVPLGIPASFAPPALRCAGNALEFSATPDPSVTRLDWDFGDPTTGAANDATGSPAYHNFSAPGTYTVTTTTTNAYGCTAVFSQNISVTPNALSGNITPINPPVICEGKTLTLTAPNGGVSYFWSDSTTTTQAITVGKAGNYRVTVTDASGCTYAPPAVRVDINPAPDAVVKALIENDLGQVIGAAYPSLTTCFGEDVHLQVFGNGANYGYTWSGGNGNQDEVFFTDERGNLLSVGNHVYSVTVTNFSNGCTSVTSPFLVEVNPVPTGFSIAANGACAGSPVAITYSGPKPANWQFIWSNGVLGTDLSTEEPGKYRIRVINEFGCEARSNEVVIMPGPNVAAIPGGCHSRCKPDSLCVPEIPGIVSWQWFKDGSPVPGGTSPDFVAQESGTYWAELVDNMGCKGTSDPLTLALYDGYGNIAGQVWSDVNKSGTIDAGDTLMSGVAVRLLRNGTALDTLLSSGGGGFVFANILSTDYTVQMLADQFGPNWKIIIGQAGVKLIGCDALGLTNLLVQYVCPPRQSTVGLKACPGGFATYNGQNVPTGSSQIFTFKAPDGCDSTVTVTVAPLPISIISLALKTCPGTTVNYNGTPLAIGQTQAFVLKSAVTGCDSIVNVTVSALPTSGSSLNLKTCPGTPVVYEGVSLSVGATQNFTLKNYLGCDSMVAVTVSALQTSSSSLTLKTCPGTTATYNGSPLAIGTTQDFQFKNYLNCDSTVTVTVVALSTSSSSLTLKTCPGTSVVYGGVSLSVGASQSFTLKNHLGCDSVVAVTVAALPTSTRAIGLKACPGQTLTYGGATLKAGDVKQFVFKNYLNCDSTVTVTVTESLTSASVLNAEVCPGEKFTYEGVTLSAGQTRDFVLINADGCDSTVTVTVTELPTVAFDAQAKPSCANAPNGTLTVLAPLGVSAPYRYSLDGTKYQDELIFKDLPAGTYTIWLEDDNGCLFQREAQVAGLAALDVALLGGVLPCDSTAVALSPVINAGDTTGLKFLWHNGLTTPSIQLAEAGAVWVELKNQCETLRREADVVWADLPSGFTPVYVPNVFMPDAREPENHQFKPFFATGLRLLAYEFAVFDRWGNLMFRTNQSEAAWNGVFRSDDMEPGVYVWYLEANIGICGRTMAVKRKGDVTVVR